MSLSVWFFLLGMSLPLVACAEVAAYTIKDSGVPSAQAAVVWLDNERVLFHGSQLLENPASQSSSEEKHKAQFRLFLWDTTQGKVGEYTKLDYMAPLCVHDGTLTYLRQGQQQTQIVTAQVRDGRLSDEQTKPLLRPHWFNPFNCHYYDSPPPWKVKGRATTPLLEEHGYLDWGPEGGEESRLTLYLPGATGGMQLPIRRHGLSSHISYEPNRKAYLIPSSRYRDPVTDVVQDVGGSWPMGKPLPIWWLTPAGIITEEQIPYAPLMARGSRGFLAAKVGIFVWSHAIAVKGGPGDAGGYLFQEGTIRKLIAGYLGPPAISPDGCKVAFVHDPYDTEFGKNRRDRITVKVIDLCEGGNHAEFLIPSETNEVIAFV